MPFCHARLKAKKPLPAAYPTELKRVGDRLRKQGLDLGLRQRDVAHLLGVDETTVSNWERHRTEPTRRFVSQIVKFVTEPSEVATP